MRRSGIIAKPLKVGMAEHEVSSRFMSDKGVGRPISAKHAVRIRIEFRHVKDRQVFNNGSRAIACADNFCHWGSFRPTRSVALFEPGTDKDVGRRHCRE